MRSLCWVTTGILFVGEGNCGSLANKFKRSLSWSILLFYYGSRHTIFALSTFLHTSQAPSPHVAVTQYHISQLAAGLIFFSNIKAQKRGRQAASRAGFHYGQYNATLWQNRETVVKEKVNSGNVIESMLSGYLQEILNCDS